MIKTYCANASYKGMFSTPFIPSYATHNLSLVTELQIIENCSARFMSYSPDLMSGATASTCPTPCTTTTTNTILTYSVDHYVNRFYLYFDKSIRVTNVTLDKLHPMVSLNFLGSNLGLWPGLGICQLFEWFFNNILSRIRMKAKMLERIFNAGN